MELMNPRDWYWTHQKWDNDILPANADEIIDIANRLIDEFIALNPNATRDAITDFCVALWDEYCLCRWMPAEPLTNPFERCNYDTLVNKALSTDARQIDIDTLGEYLACWGEGQSNTDEYYLIGNGRRLYPIYSRWPDRHGTLILLRYEIK